jgi:hypothetical protein
MKAAFQSAGKTFEIKTYPGAPHGFADYRASYRREAAEDAWKEVATEGDAVVKTIGDAVMATFLTPDHALAAALKMREAMRRLNETHRREDLLLKIGIHEGPCLAVNRATGLFRANGEHRLASTGACDVAVVVAIMSMRRRSGYRGPDRAARNR